MTEQLKPCPFCGGTPKTIDRPDNIDGTQFFYAISCYCGRHSACAHKMAVRPTPEEAKQVATEAWNTRAALAQPAEVEPVAWVVKMPGGYHDCGYDSGVLNKVPHGTMLYTHPPARVPLTDEELAKVLGFGEYTTESTRMTLIGIARAIERAHGIGGGK